MKRLIFAILAAITCANNVTAQKKQEVFLFLLDFKVLNWYDKEVC